jgi:hypothetical protein
MTPTHLYEPDSIGNFLFQYFIIFSRHYLNGLKEKFDSFDGMVSTPVSPGFLRSRTFEAWTEMLLDVVFQSSYKRMQSTIEFDGTDEGPSANNKADVQ